MMSKLSECVGCVVHASDGEVGTVEELYLDDVAWRVRYLAVKMAQPPGRTVLLSVAAVRKPDWNQRVIPVDHTLGQVLASPVATGDAPGTRQHEIALHRHYLWPVYWLGGFYELPALALAQGGIEVGELAMASPRVGVRKREAHLRAMREVMDCRVHAVDGLLGGIQDALIDDETWSIRYLIVNMHTWLPMRLVLVSPQWMTKVRWLDHEIQVDLTREIIKTSPRVRLAEIGSPVYESKLLGHVKKASVTEWVLFRMHAPPSAEVYVTGTFNQWQPTAIRLGEVCRGVYSAMILLPVGRYEYRFRVNGAWVNGPTTAAQVPNPYGSTNSVLLVGRQPGHTSHLHTFARESDGGGGSVMLANWRAE